MVIPFRDLELKEEVGEGGFGVVRKGYWTSSDGRKKLVAIKQLKGMDKHEVRLKKRTIERFTWFCACVSGEDLEFSGPPKHHHAVWHC